MARTKDTIDGVVTARVRAAASGAAAVALAVAVVGVLAHAFWYDFISDDAFIVARYARNVVEGHGLVYNIGDRVEGYTSVLSVLMTAMLGWLGVDYITALRALSLAGAVLTVVLVSRITVRYRFAPPGHPLLAGVAPVLCASSSTFACWALGGLETCAYAALILAVGYTVAKPGHASPGRLAVVGVLCGLCVLTRPEGMIVALACVPALWLAPPRPTIRGAVSGVLAFLVIAIGHVAWRYAYYGFFLPNTFYAKVGFTTAQIARGMEYVVGFVGDHGSIILWVLPVVMVPMFHRTRLHIFLALTAVGLTAGVVLVGGDGLAMYRFMTPVVPIWALLFTQFLADLDARLSTACRPGQTWVAHGVAAVVAAFAVFALITPPQRLSQYELYAAHQQYEIPRWRAAGAWLHDHAAAGASLAAVPIGAVGYYSGLHVYDMLGLTDTHIAHRSVPIGTGWPGHEKFDGAYILSKTPTYLLLGNIRVLDQPLSPDDPEFVRPEAAVIREREDDIFVPALTDRYTPRQVELPEGWYFHFLERRDVVP